MIFGSHVILYSSDAEADRAFFRDILGFDSVDAGHGWLIFALPPAEAAIHPAEGSPSSELYFMCDNLDADGLAAAGGVVRRAGRLGERGVSRAVMAGKP